MDYILEHAKEIMMLCFGVGFLLLSIYLSRAIIIATRLMKKIDDLTDLTIHYINKPLSMIIHAEKVVTRFLERIMKK